MIPTALLVGVIAGAAARPRVAIAVGVTTSLLWGLIVGVSDGSLATFIGGTAIAAANLLVGLSLGVLGRRVLSGRRSIVR